MKVYNTVAISEIVNDLQAQDYKTNKTKPEVCTV